MLLNCDKTQLVCFSPSGVDEDFIVNSEDFRVKSVSSCKFLGINIDTKFSWDVHIDYVCKKISPSLFLLRRLNSYLNTDMLIKVYYGLVYPYLSYGLLLWGSAAKTHMDRVFILQKKSLRLLAKVKHTESCKNIFIEYNILTIYALYIYQVIMLVKQDKKYTNKNRDIHSHNTRRNVDFFRVNRNTKTTENSPFVKGTIFFNALPQQIKVLEGNNFRNNLKQFLIKKCPYSLKL